MVVDDAARSTGKLGHAFWKRKYQLGPSPIRAPVARLRRQQSFPKQQPAGE
jgi:hypothetical protein